MDKRKKWQVTADVCHGNGKVAGTYFLTVPATSATMAVNKAMMEVMEEYGSVNTSISVGSFIVRDINGETIAIINNFIATADEEKDVYEAE